MIKMEKSIVVSAPVEQVFAYINDPARELEYMTGVDEVKDIKRLPDGRYSFTEVDKFLGMHFDTKCEATEVVPNERIVEKMRGGGMDGVMTMRFEPLEGGKTRVSLTAETNIHAGPVSKFSEAFMVKYMDHGTSMAMEAAKAHIEAESASR